MPATADADSKGWVHMECNQLLCGCAIVFHTRLVTHPDVEKPYPSRAAELSLDGLVGAAEARSQKPVARRVDWVKLHAVHCTYVCALGAYIALVCRSTQYLMTMLVFPSPVMFLPDPCMSILLGHLLS